MAKQYIGTVYPSIQIFYLSAQDVQVKDWIVVNLSLQLLTIPETLTLQRNRMLTIIRIRIMNLGRR